MTSDQPVVTGELKVTHPIENLREMVAMDIKRTSPAESWMIRSGLLADLLDELARHRTAHSLPGDVATLLLDAVKNASGFLDTPVARRKIGDDPFYKDVVASIRAALASPEPRCHNCEGEGWVCENHETRAWPTACECGAGAPCPVCTPSALSGDAREALDCEGLGDALGVLSHKLRMSGFLATEDGHTAYEKVVAEFQALSSKKVARHG